jgi:hypothetical protein
VSGTNGEISEVLPTIVTGGDDIIPEVPATEGESKPLPDDIPLDWSRIEINEDGEIMRILDMTTVEEVKEFLASHTRDYI